MLTLLLACAEPEPEGPCPVWADEVVADGVLDNSHDCGTWTLPVGEHLYVNVYIEEIEVPCSDVIDDGVDRPHEPAYTNMSNDAPKWTYDYVGGAAVDVAEITITCEEGTEWHARVHVVAAQEAGARARRPLPLPGHSLRPPSFAFRPPAPGALPNAPGRGPLPLTGG